MQCNRDKDIHSTLLGKYCGHREETELVYIKPQYSDLGFQFSSSIIASLSTPAHALYPPQ